MRLAFEDDIKKYINAQIDDHKKNYSRDEIRDFIDLFIKYETEQREFYDGKLLKYAQCVENDTDR